MPFSFAPQNIQEIPVMSYKAPLKDMLFNIEHLARIDQIAAMPGFEDAGLETAQAVLEECARFNEGVLAPLNFEADKAPSSLQRHGRSPPAPASRRPTSSTPKAAGKACSTLPTLAARACPRPSARPAGKSSTRPT
jgi:hypothetical protein